MNDREETTIWHEAFDEDAFEEINSQGVRTYGLSWLNANSAAIAVLDELGIDISEPLIRHLSMGIVKATLDFVAKKYPDLKWPTVKDTQPQA